MGDPIFWLGLSILLVAVSLAAVLVTALPALQELARAARSAEKLFDTLSRELPPTLESIRLTSREINNLKADMSEGVQGTSQVVQEVSGSIVGVKQQAKQVNTKTRSVMAGVKAAWSVFKGSDRRLRQQLSAHNAEEFEREEFEPEEFEREELELETRQEMALGEAELWEPDQYADPDLEPSIDEFSQSTEAILEAGDIAAHAVDSDRNGNSVHVMPKQTAVEVQPRDAERAESSRGRT